MERRGLPGTLCGAGAETEPEMSEAILTFQVQLSGVMETVLKSAMYEITRLVEDSFLEEVARSKQEVESLRQRLQWWESRRREREGRRGRRGVRTAAALESPGRGHTPPPPPHHLRCSEQQDWSSTKRQDTAPPAGQRLTEQQGRQRAGETCGFYAAGSEHCAGSGDHLDSERGAWTAFKLGDSDSEAEAPGSSYTAEQKPASPSAGPAVEGGADSASPLHCLSVKSEGGVPHSVAVKEEVEIQPVCGEEIRADLAHTRHRRHRETWDRGDMQVENTAHLPPSQDAAKRLKAFSDKVESLTSQFRQQQHGPLEKSIKLNTECSAPENFQVKRSKARSTDGKRTFSNVARQVLTQSRVWQNACYSKNIDWKPVTAKIISTLPQLLGREAEVIDRCTKMLQNRREYLRRTGQARAHTQFAAGVSPEKRKPGDPVSSGKG
ncbi:hypothetical protein MATL_G00220560 [Megalops atlanticus]|uniref:Uncharacterized protein n=1 Tax=Megalops atlanticus TaxID=7932 RepID=A0A9D3PJ11_MEGAT|nr:hypothetical protein MATL_G00220560 [Megalops atlanticus]